MVHYLLPPSYEYFLFPQVVFSFLRWPLIKCWLDSFIEQVCFTGVNNFLKSFRWIRDQQESEGVTPGEDVYIILRLDGRVRRSGRVSALYGILISVPPWVEMVFILFDILGPWWMLTGNWHYKSLLWIGVILLGLTSQALESKTLLLEAWIL